MTGAKEAVGTREGERDKERERARERETERQRDEGTRGNLEVGIN